MPTDFATAARGVLASEGDLATSEQAALAASNALGKLEKQLARVVGEHGVQTILGRSVIIAASEYPWLGRVNTDRGCADLAAIQIALAAHPPAVVGDAFVHVLATFVEVLGRLIGPGLVTRFLSEVWPSIFPIRASEGTP